MSKTKEASRVKKTAFTNYCARMDCVEWATYYVFDKEVNNVGGYCRDCSEFLVRALNRMSPSTVKKVDVASFFPPL